MPEKQESEQQKFCGVCRGPIEEGGVGIHEPWCPVLTGEPVAGVYPSVQQTVEGWPLPQQQPGVNPQDMQPFYPSQPLNILQQMAGLVAPAQGPAQQLQAAAEGKPGVYGMNPDMLRQGQIPREDGYEVAKIYREARERLLEELRLQVEVNRTLSRELIEARMEIAQLKSWGQDNRTYPEKYPDS